MGLLSLPARLPFLPISGLIGLAQIIQDEAEREWHDPVSVRRTLERIEDARLAGEISGAEAADAEQQAVARLVHVSPPVTGADHDVG